MQILNLTPHNVVIVSEGEEVVTYSPEPTAARVSVQTVQVGKITDQFGNRIPVTRSVYGKVTNLPEQKNGTAYIVSLLVAKAAKEEGRDISDLFIPNETVRDEQGRIVGCQSVADLL